MVLQGSQWLTAARPVVERHFHLIDFSFSCVLRFLSRIAGGMLTMAGTRASEELIAAPLPDLVRDLGRAVAKANQDLRAIEDNELQYTIDDAEIELNVAISIDTSTTVNVSAGGNISVFNVNASYARTYGYKEEASSRIKLHLSARPPVAASTPAAGGGG